ncbi:scamp-domain-containing protein, partial [Rhizoclosmatium globosum]
REAELNRREAMLNQREVQVEKKEALMEGYNPPNFPPCKPLVYHDIEKDIPQEGKWIVKRIYYHWLFSVLNYLINAITGFILLVNKAESAGGNFGAALIMLVAITPVSFVFWYQPLYNGVKRNRSVQFFLFQFNYIAHIGLAGLMSAGIPGWGGAGIIYCISNIGSNIGLGVMCAITSAGFIYQVVYGMWQVKAVRSYYMARGMNAEEAKQQALTGVAQSGLGKEIIKTAIRTQV